MSDMERPVTEEDLHAYLDGELAEDRRALVEAYLQAHPEDAERLEAYRAHGEAIRRLYADVGDRPSSTVSPLRPRSVRSTSWRRAAAWGRITQVPWQRAAAIALLIAGAVAAGLLGLTHDRSDDALWARFGADAIAAHLQLTRPASKPAIAASLQDVSDYLSEKLKTRIELRSPANSPYALVGAKFVPTAKGRVAQLAFRSTDGKLVTMFMEPWPGKPDAPFRVVAREGDVVTMVWVDDAVGCAVSGNLPPEELEQAARSLYDELIG